MDRAGIVQGDPIHILMGEVQGAEFGVHHIQARTDPVLWDPGQGISTVIIVPIDEFHKIMVPQGIGQKWPDEKFLRKRMIISGLYFKAPMSCLSGIPANILVIPY